MNLKQSFGICLKRLREQRSLTQEQLAEMINKTGDGISQIERGVIAPSFDTLELLSRALGVPVRDLFGIDETEVSPKRAKLLADLMDSTRALTTDDLELAVRQVGLVVEHRRIPKTARDRPRPKSGDH